MENTTSIFFAGTKAFLAWLLEDFRSTAIASGKTAISWVLLWSSAFTVAKFGTYLAICYTLLQLYVTLRDKIFNRRRDDYQ